MTVAVPSRATRSRRVALLAAAALVLVLVRVFVVAPLRVDGDSMAPTLRSGDVAVVRKFGAPHTGQVVVLTDPQDGSLVVKRVVALGGQTVEIRDAYLYVDGVEVAEPYVDHSRIDGVYFGPVTVPAGDVFVLGDSRNGSIDSRIFGPVPAAAVSGRVLVRLWPPVR
ncbi:MAG TPA: signal peptidase I [Mycobacteriales bacterium]|nr:signal peptidase I [Mycobacteriales bacterium]